MQGCKGAERPLRRTPTLTNGRRSDLPRLRQLIMASFAATSFCSYGRLVRDLNSYEYRDIHSGRSRPSRHDLGRIHRIRSKVLHRWKPRRNGIVLAGEGGHGGGDGGGNNNNNNNTKLKVGDDGDGPSGPSSPLVPIAILLVRHHHAPGSFHD
eukprot:scaffold178707_cov39-Prasinocladus_malaysianus.AAC.1